ncbi:UDP-2,4-diacetamido-2,4,6-trideoxy-beta-L-altropyranose hydrolase [Shewanella vesiculosa]|jgi:UDP-2,4-diacetamido-2,4,6-trideoxy-beta-L-altropyranose hydrolase|uniref:UDP-2,4-diacetamido-2,4, 6-trideoxy-beta-L-altropyranose hydrolase n=1 Tax=Shewanella vesiculosa TaxID=518738 RepID=UPI000F4FD2B9|nr:UDP-2,4-diacetamido-2,4,6-trideoxy-beta-L-altropyranose hydrolase [Shewanella vesiculosa]RPA50718.1 UDP-2,4-diacetamido-2,4,6-trideoxy-beta-L-altropyranose hydrolase [Shewanella vesiculosa]UJL44287.1 UDP-2,4-diacetamido-2,4,6-trideoxy-beta-L-altropyranose hydrolase [Shewanella vesiculosa]
MNIVFRVDSSFIIGSGHLIRCLTLAKLLNKKIESNIYFITKRAEKNFNDLIIGSGFNLIELDAKNAFPINDNWLGWTQEQDFLLFENAMRSINISKFDVLIVDHYSLDIVWEEKASRLARKIVVIDDLANRKHSCNILIDQNLALNYQHRYDDLVTPECQLFLGVSYCILRDEFLCEISNSKPRESLNKIFVFFGGVDKDNLSLKFVNGVMPVLSKSISVDLVIGMANPNKKELKQACAHFSNIQCFEHGVNIAEMMREADLAIGAGGATTGERIFMGLPSIVYSLADNQIEVSQYLHDIGLIYYMGDQNRFSAEALMRLIEGFKISPALLHAKSSELLLVFKHKLSVLCEEITSDRSDYE